MALIPWKPFADLDRFFEDEDWFLPVISKGNLLPEMDLYETDKEVVAEINAPGIDPEKTEIVIDNGYLKVKGRSRRKRRRKRKITGEKKLVIAPLKGLLDYLLR